MFVSKRIPNNMCIVQGLATPSRRAYYKRALWFMVVLHCTWRLCRLGEAVTQTGFRICRTYAVRDAKCLPKISETSGYFTFLLHTSQYLSIKITPSPILNRASTVAKLPQLTQYFVFPLWRTSVKDLNEVNTFSILLFHLMGSKRGLFFITQGGCDTNKNVLKCYRKVILNNLNNSWL